MLVLSSCARCADPSPTTSRSGRRKNLIRIWVLLVFFRSLGFSVFSLARFLGFSVSRFSHSQLKKNETRTGGNKMGSIKRQLENERTSLKRLVRGIQEDAAGGLASVRKAAKEYEMYGPFPIETAESGKFEFGVRPTDDPGLLVNATLQLDDNTLLCSISIHVRYAGHLPGKGKDPLLMREDDERSRRLVYGHIGRVMTAAPDGTPVAFISLIRKNFPSHTSSTRGMAMRLLGQLMCALSRMGVVHGESHVIAVRGDLSRTSTTGIAHDDAKLREVYTKAGFSEIAGTRGMTTTAARLCRRGRSGKVSGNGGPCSLQ